ncbi:radical SAM protein [Thermodesulfovibrio sp. 3907-1M]|uniref:Radical SAM protein n=1 Tax=Thermodesulfovibrio autotrophicus TaxID=3118333 RepID=A0AAU8GU45_9BACT
MSSSKAQNVAYLNLSDKEFNQRIEKAFEILKDCTLCPRNCYVDRTSGRKGACKVLIKPYVSSWGPHFGEEAPLVGRYGSGTIFFGFCNLSCVYCQNWTISHLGEGEEISYDELAQLMIFLQNSGCHNINLVTPTHQVPQIIKSIYIAREQGLRIPIVYNCGGYEAIETLKILDGIIDIYMPDFKYADSALAEKYSKVKNYTEFAKKALKEMHRQVGDLIINEEGVAVRGLLVRHLVLPNNIAGTQEIVKFIAEEISKNTYINIMDQYRPCWQAEEYPELNRRITQKEFEDAVNMALKYGLTRIDCVIYSKRYYHWL